MENTEEYCNRIIQEMIKSYEDTGNKDGVSKLCREAYSLYRNNELPSEYYGKIYYTAMEIGHYKY
ncbi:MULTISPECIES: hypothetical protein [Clostridium]|nr:MULTISPECIES: hypothetical protein [Clostridium]AVK47259.1 hypothetical protein AXY43_04055 [Clostridium sp. MF28]PSM56623.1 hypothetical protein C4L39_16550 [Clostridium diolis]